MKRYIKCMKKILILGLLMIVLFISSEPAEACSPMSDVIYPTVQDILSAGGIVTL